MKSRVPITIALTTGATVLTSCQSRQATPDQAELDAISESARAIVQSHESWVEPEKVIAAITSG